MEMFSRIKFQTTYLAIINNRAQCNNFGILPKPYAEENLLTLMDIFKNRGE